MRTAARRPPSYRWLVLVLVADVFGLAALVLNQWLEGPLWVALAFAAGVAIGVFPWLMKLADTVFSAAGIHLTIPLVGEKSPWAGLSKSEQSDRTSP